MSRNGPAVIGLDIGTSAVKALLATEAGWIAGARRGYHLDIGAGGRVEVDAEAVWAAARSAIRALAARARAELCSVIAVCAGGSGDEAVWLNARGAVVAPIPMALDTRSEVDGAAFVATVGDARFAGRTLLPPAGTYPLVRLIWLGRVAPRLAADVRVMLAWPEFIAVRLGAEPAAEPSLAARSAAFDPRSGKWDSELLMAAGIDNGTFPRIVPTGSVVGTLGPAIARRLGLADGALIVAGGFDQAMATLGAGATSSRVAHLGLGSWQAITILCERPDPTWSARGISCGPAIGARVGWSAMASSAGGAAQAWLGALAG
ncbi:MAG: FGGY family carbohydrate kinase, partial [Chloroflexota bacterium]|nr:FGGY family carbohydrate kinase [Chloroflexota bacterium]